MKKTISVIVPIYKVELYIRKCLDSVVNQTVTPYEVILVNDGSPDQSGEIAKAYAEKYPFFKYIEQENQGVSVARNRGMALATGAFITFLDPDDYWTHDAYEEMESLLESNEADLYHFEYITVDTEGRPVPDNPVAYTGDRVLYGTELLEKKYYFRGYAVWHDIFRASIIKEHQLTFPVGVQQMEDVVFMSKYLQFVHRILSLDKPLYMYVQREGSITQNGYTNTRAQHFLKGIHIILDDWKHQGAKTPLSIRRMAIYIFGLKQYYKTYLLKDDLQWSEMKRACSEIRHYIRKADEYGIELPNRRKVLLISYLFPFYRIYYRWKYKQ